MLRVTVEPVDRVALDEEFNEEWPMQGFVVVVHTSYGMTYEHQHVFPLAGRDQAEALAAKIRRLRGLSDLDLMHWRARSD